MVLDQKGEKPPKMKIFVMGKQYEVPAGLTIIKAMEYVGYRFIRGAGCRGGFCGACSTVYRIKGNYKLQMALACQKIIESEMYLVQIPFTPADKKTYNINELRSSGNVLLEHYPEIARCVSCNTCSKACPQDLEVMDYIQSAIRGKLEEVSNLSFDCIQCGLCAMRCPENIVPYYVALLARRLTGKYLVPSAKHLNERVDEIRKGNFDNMMEQLVRMNVDALKKRYVMRKIIK